MNDIFEFIALLIMLGGLIYYFYLEYKLEHNR